MNDRYVILTGAKNNAGDFLIKYRALQLFAALRPDREVVDFDAWKPLDDKQVEIINESRALILTGGPALQPYMYPRIYPLVDNLDRIKVPILTMAIGWKGRTGTWDESYTYPLASRTIELLQRIESSGYFSSVRDYHTLSVLRNCGLERFLVTGCAALYSLEHIHKDFSPPAAPCRVSFSLGVSFLKSKRMGEVNRQLILALRDTFSDAGFTVVFHHATDRELYRHTHKPNMRLLDGQRELIGWLEQQGIDWLDISGSADEMLEHYGQCDLHIGYRVHAHILMASLSKPTVLIAEDGRGTALREILGGLVFDGCHRPLPGLIGKVAARCGYLGESLTASLNLPACIIHQLKYELNNSYPRIARLRDNIGGHFRVMKRFVKQLP